jgi:tRNA U34 2-thiouridine synthase MnmA/TrmU
MATDKKVCGLSLFSGGLDSILAICVLRDQGLHVEAITFSSPFFNIEPARRGAAMLGVRLNVVDFTDDITELLEHPPHGFGGAMNPCIDCHARMIRRAGEEVRARGWDFVSTGEVLNQRPMSQNRRSLGIVAKDCGVEDILVRPLSAKLLEPTAPELDGRIDRERLCSIEGRSRQAQKALAERFGITEYPSPAGGCLLTEKLFCNKLKDVKERGLLHDREELDLLRTGRHFALPGGARLIVGRNKADNERLQQMVARGRTLVRPIGTPGPSCLLSANAGEEDIATAKALCAAYCDASATGYVRIRLFDTTDHFVSEETIEPMNREEARAWIL